VPSWRQEVSIAQPSAGRKPNPAEKAAITQMELRDALAYMLAHNIRGTSEHKGDNMSRHSRPL
jgi:hypothetical protein